MSVQSSVIIGGVSTEHKRNDADFYPTPPECTVALLDHLTSFRGLSVWEPACGDGAISRGVTVLSTDLHDRGYGRFGIDFLNQHKSQADVIITNPPFALAEAFIRKCAKFEVPFAMLLKSTYWHAKTRHALFRETGPAAVCPMLWRPNFAPERGKSPTMDVCWTVWADEPSDNCQYVPLPKPAPHKDIFS